MKRKRTIAIEPDGTIVFVYDDALAPLLTHGDYVITRVSAVEPAQGGWSATMTDGTVLGPFPLRQQALDAEVAYLEEKLFGS